MKNFYPILFLFAAKCADPTCETPCGIYVKDVKGFTCEEISEVERRSVIALSKTADTRLQAGNCALLWGVGLEFMPTKRWVDSDGLEVEGRYYCDKRIIRLGKSDTLASSSFSHEIAHVLQDCVPMEPFEEDYYHSNWLDAGFYDAFEEVERGYGY